MAKGFLAPYTTADIILFVVAAVASLVALMSAREQWSSSRALLLAAFVMIVFVQSKHAWGGNQLGEAAATIFLLIAVSGTMLPSNKAARALPAAPRIALLAGAGAAAVLLVRTDAWTRSLVTHGEPVTYTARQAVPAGRPVRGGGHPGATHYPARARRRATAVWGISP